MLSGRDLKNLFWFLVGVLLVAVPMFSHAETIAATGSGTGVVAATYYSEYGYGTYDTTKEAACTAHGRTWGTGGNYGKCYYAGIFEANVVASTCPSGSTNTNGSSGYCSGPTYTCPTGQNWTLSGSTCTRPDCTGTQVRNADTGVCQSPCGAEGGTFSTGIYDMGTSPTNFAAKVSCTSGGCTVIFDGVAPKYTRLVGGVRHYYAAGGYGYAGTSQTCNASTSTATPSASLTAPTDTCGTGQTMGTLNGVTTCIDTATKTTTTTSNATDTSTKTNTTVTTTSSGTSTTTTDSTTKSSSCDGTNCTTTTTTNNADGSKTVTTSTTDQKSYCDSNPTATMCQTIEQGTAADTSSLYTKGDKTIAGVFSDFSVRVQGSGFFSAANNFFSVSIPSGSCSGNTISVPVSIQGGSGNFVVDLDSVLCGSNSHAIYSALSYGLLLGAIWCAYKIAIL